MDSYIIQHNTYVFHFRIEDENENEIHFTQYKTLFGMRTVVSMYLLVVQILLS